MIPQLECDLSFFLKRVTFSSPQLVDLESHDLQHAILLISLIN